MTVQAQERGEGATVSYVEFATDIAISGTTEAGATPIVAALPVVASGGDSFVVRFFCPAAVTNATAGGALLVCLYDNGVPIVAGLSRIGALVTPAAVSTTAPMLCERRLSPAAGSHTYSITAFKTGAGNGTMQGSQGGTSQPGYIWVMRA